MTTFTLYKAAKECGTSRPTLLRAIKNGELVATFDKESNQWQVELAELLAAGFNPGKPSPPLEENPDREDVREHEHILELEHELAIYKIRLTSTEDVIRTQQALIEAQEKSLEDLRIVTRMLTQRGGEGTATSNEKRRWWQKTNSK